MGDLQRWEICRDGRFGENGKFSGKRMKVME